MLVLGVLTVHSFPDPFVRLARDLLAVGFGFVAGVLVMVPLSWI